MNALLLGGYTASDSMLVAALGVLGGMINVLISSVPHGHFMLWGARAPYVAFFVLTPVIAMLLVRKPGVALLTALVYAAVQCVYAGSLMPMRFGIMEGLGVEITFALFRYGRFDALSAFLAGGIGAKTLGNLWRFIAGGGAMSTMGGETAPWQVLPGGEILGLLVFGVLSGPGGWVLAKAIDRTRLAERLRTRWGHTSAGS